MVVNPDSNPNRYKYLIENSDYSLLVTDTGVKERNGNDYPGEKVFWYTSGTTGDSKFYSFTQKQLDTVCETICSAYDITADDRYYGVMPLWHAHGQGLYWAVKHAGCESLFGTLRDVKKIQNFQPTFVSCIPDMLQVYNRMTLSDLRFIRTASGALPNKLYNDTHNQFQVPVIEAFGMTESLSHCFTNPLHGEQRIGTIGMPSGINARITNGELEIKGPTLFTSDWFSTGDLAEQDEAGYFRVLGRKQDQINVRGIKFNPLSLENQLFNQFENLQECAIFGEDRINCVFVGEVDSREISNFLGELNTNCNPKKVIQLTEIPKNASGKVSRRMLCEMF